MSLATRCTACGTVFRVVQDQLKVSEGWVRCGRCDQVFNAIEGLFDLERDAPPDWNPPPAPPQPPAASITANFQPPEAPPEDEEDVFHLSDEDRIHSRFFQPEQEDVAHTPAQTVAERDRVDFADARFNDALLADAEGDNPSTERPPAEDLDVPLVPGRKRSKSSKSKPGKVKQTPEFLRDARRKALWRTPQMRIGLSLASVLLLAGLTAQVSLHFRDAVATHWPVTRPWLVAACESLGCSVGWPQRINDITVESSGLAPLGDVGTYRLTVVLRNRSAVALAVPAIDLSLTDADGQAVIRRALVASEFRTAPTRLPADSDTPLQLQLAADDPRVRGYTVEIFYP